KAGKLGAQFKGYAPELRCIDPCRRQFSMKTRVQAGLEPSERILGRYPSIGQQQVECMVPMQSARDSIMFTRPQLAANPPCIRIFHQFEHRDLPSAREHTGANLLCLELVDASSTKLQKSFDGLPSDRFPISAVTVTIGWYSKKARTDAV